MSFGLTQCSSLPRERCAALRDAPTLRATQQACHSLAAEEPTCKQTLSIIRRTTCYFTSLLCQPSDTSLHLAHAHDHRGCVAARYPTSKQSQAEIRVRRATGGSSPYQGDTMLCCEGLSSSGPARSSVTPSCSRRNRRLRFRPRLPGQLQSSYSRSARTPRTALSRRRR